MATEIIPDEPIVMDRLALSRAQHLKSRDNRAKSISDDEIDAISDWSESDRECCPLSDFESTSNVDPTHGTNRYNISFDDDDDGGEEFYQQLPNETSLLEKVLRLEETPVPVIDDSTTSTRISFSSDLDKSKEINLEPIITKKPPIQIRKQSQPSLLPARRIQTKEISPRRMTTTNAYVLSQSNNSSSSSRHRKLITPPHPPRYYLRRELTTTSTTFHTSLPKESTGSPNTSFHSHDDNGNLPRQIVSPNFSQTSTNNALVPRVYELKKLFVDDYDYGRLTDVSTAKTIPARNRQKWGTIVHPPFPLGYQQIPPEQVTQAVERLSSPVRCRERHTPVQTPSKRYLSVEETDALVINTIFHSICHSRFSLLQINRLTKVKPIRAPDQYWPLQRPSRPVKNFNNTLKTNTNWKGVGISA